ncbi:DUF1223 domain-containing protein [Methylobacterium sp. BTF04]|uniref:DUF1223 domain-containing protein n=1 Tax=Methylobacterium sp. BTF04 TaxID=2708300 RepID=UPI0019543D83|nr:DUF1223 domain-containing protein [Methylobacterium sp. BTF04]
MTPRSLRSCLRLLLAGIPMAAMTPAWAAEGAQVVIELFTSQGCASCPPASQVLSEFAKKPGIIALTFPVTYWDYLGWKDDLGLPAFTDRQRAYANLRGVRQLFTPQAIVNGEPSMVRSDRDSLDRNVRNARKAGAFPVQVRSTEQGDRIAIEIDAASGPETQGEVWLLPVLHKRTVAIGQGENKGQVIEYINVVRGLQRVGSWAGRAARYDIPRSTARVGEADTYVVVLQGGSKNHPARILGAAAAPGF